VTERSIYEFGDVRVDMGRMAALRGNVPIPLEPKAFDVLAYLIAHRDRLVTKEELLDTVWTGTFVTPNVLTRAVAQIRKALGDESQNARFIETAARRGYRFIAPVTVLQSAAPEAVPVDAARGHGTDTAVRPDAIVAARRNWKRAGLLAALSLVLLVALTFYLSRATAPSAQPPGAAAELQVKRLTNRRGFTGTPSLSPDGRSVVYSSDATGALELYLTSLAPGSAEVPLTNDGGHNVQPCWSPDGQWIAFHSRRRGGVWIIPSSGGGAQQVVEFGSDPAWSPDSSTIVFTSDSGGFAGQSTLWTIRRDGSERRQLTKVGTPPGGHRTPAWSRDGRHVAFVVSLGGWKTDVWTVDVESGETNFVDTSPYASDPIFGPGDRALIWGGTTRTGNGRMFRRAIDAQGKPAGALETLLPMEAGIVEGLSLAANGTLAFMVRGLDANLWATDVGASGRGSEPIRLTDDLSRNTRPDYSIDGRVAYLVNAVGSLPAVWMMRDDGSDRRPVVPDGGATDPQWDPAGKRILVVRGEAGSAGRELAWVDLASLRLTSIAPVNGMQSPRLSPDGTSLAFFSVDQDGRLSVSVSSFDGARRRIATDPEAVSYPAWSRDGAWLAVEVKRGDSTQVGVVSAAGGPVVLLTSGRGQSFPHTWAPDNDRIAFAGQRDGVWNLYTVSRSTRAMTQVTFFKSSTGYVRYPAWSSTGSRIVFERAIETANVWTMTLPPEER